MWLFVDESWSPPGYIPAYGVLLGVLVRHDQLDRLENLLFAVRKKYYGRDHAKDLRRELKGNELMSNHVLRLWKPRSPAPRNLCIVRELITYPKLNPDFHLRLVASIVYSTGRQSPPLVSPDPRQLAEPFRHLVQSASMATQEHAPERAVTLVFDERLGSQRDIAIAVRNFVSGMRLPNVHRYPYFAVSNVSPGIQLADVFAHLLSKRVQQVRPIMGLYSEMRPLQWASQGTPKRFGFVRLNEHKDEKGRLTYRRRSTW
jgi:hypothetical protein